MPNQTLREKFQRLAALKDEAETADMKRLIEAIELQTSILNEQLFKISLSVAPNMRGASAIRT